MVPPVSKSHMTTSRTFDWSIGPTEAVIEAVATELEMDPMDLDAPLNSFVDPDALDSIFAPTNAGLPRADGRVTFSVGKCDVVVTAGGEVRADRRNNNASTARQVDESRTPG